MKAALEQFGFKGCKDADLEPVFTYLEFCLKQVKVARTILGSQQQRCRVWIRTCCGFTLLFRKQRRARCF